MKKHWVFEANIDIELNFSYDNLMDTRQICILLCFDSKALMGFIIQLSRRSSQIAAFFTLFHFKKRDQRTLQLCNTLIARFFGYFIFPEKWDKQKSKSILPILFFLVLNYVRLWEKNKVLEIHCFSNVEKSVNRGPLNSSSFRRLSTTW